MERSRKILGKPPLANSEAVAGSCPSAKSHENVLPSDTAVLEQEASQARPTTTAPTARSATVRTAKSATAHAARPMPAPARWPSVSVIVPARNAEEVIGSALDSILAQDYAGSVEVVVADGSDTRATGDMVRQRYPAVRLVANPGRIAASGLNAALDATTGEVVVRCDVHAVLPPGYVRNAVEALDRTGAANVGGGMEPVGTTFFGRAVALATTSLLGSGGSRHRYGGGTGPVDTVYLGVFRRRALDEVGWYNVATPINEDYELNWRLRQQGHTVWFDPSLRVRYHTRKTWRALVRQYLGYGWSKRLTLREHPSSLRPRQLAAGLPMLALATAAVLGSTGASWAVSAMLPASYAALLLAYSLVEGIRRRDPAAAALPLVLTTMHLSWAIGFFFPTRFFLPARIQERLNEWSEETRFREPLAQ